MEYSDIEERLLLYYEGKLTKEEHKEVEEWIAQSADHYRTAQQIQLLHLAADMIQVAPVIHTKKALAKVKKRMQVRQVTAWEWVQRVAAVLCLPLILTVWIQYINKEQLGSQLVEVKTNPGMTTSVVLSDSTVVYLNSCSSLRYPLFFTGDTREVTLTGEAFFEVAKDRDKKFIVSAPHHTQIEVLGTHFNIEAYEDEDNISTTLLEGSVCFLFGTGKGNVRKIRMRPGQKLIYQASKEKMQLYATSGVSETAWKDGELSFQDLPLGEVLRMLEKRFHVEFIVTDKKLNEYTFTGTFTEHRLERILEYFRVSSKINWRYLDNPDIIDERDRIEIY